MATKTRTIRAPLALWDMLDARAAELDDSSNAVAVDILTRDLAGVSAEPAPPMAKAAPRPAKAPVPAKPPADKPAAARAALAEAESKVGAKRAKLDTSSVPVFDGGKRPPYVKGQGKAGARGRG